LKREIQYFFAAVKVVALLIFAVFKEEVEGHLFPESARSDRRGTAKEELLDILFQ
jgi:hypothetical protein